LLKQQTMPAENISTEPANGTADFRKEAEVLAQRLFRNNLQAKEKYIQGLEDIYAGAANKDFLVIHSPGGWGNSEWDDVQEWEKSIVTGVTATLQDNGYSYYVTQYLRSGKRPWGHILDIVRDLRFFSSGHNRRAERLAAGLELLARKLAKGNIILVAASQGAAFDNAVVKATHNTPNIYSIELGTFFPYMKRRLLTERTLAIDGNGLIRDPMCERDLWKGAKAYFKAFGKWFKYNITGKHVKFTRCINTPGHEYNWEFPAVHTNITKFLKEKFGMKNTRVGRQ